MAVNTCEMWSNGIKKAFFKKLRKLPSCCGLRLRPQTPIASDGRGICPQTPVCDTFELPFTLLKTSGGSRKFWWGGIWSTKPQKFGCLHQNWEWFFGRNRKFKRFFRPNSGGLQKKKKKGLHQNWDWFFAGLVTFRSVGGDASRNGAELFETEADFSAKIVTFRPVGGMHPPHPPPKSATAQNASLDLDIFAHCNYWFKPSPLNKFLVTSQHQATASDLPFYDIFAPTKNFSFKVSDNVIACDLWFDPPPQAKMLATPMITAR